VKRRLLIAAIIGGAAIWIALLVAAVYVAHWFAQVFS
jgi:hypothetical protein